MDLNLDVKRDKINWIIRQINLLLLTTICLGLPLIGVRLAGKTVKPYFQFPPTSQLQDYTRFSLPSFIFLSTTVAVLIITWLRMRTPPSQPHSKNLNFQLHHFPSWGWVGLIFAIATWILAWSRFSWFAPLQSYTFTPLWLAYIVVINAIIHRRRGASPLLEKPKFFFLLFPVSSAFWWVFEYLNRFVQNWQYLGLEEINASEYIIHASIAFSTVLPAVFSTQQLLQTFPRLQRNLDRNPRIIIPWEKEVALITLAIVSLAFFFIGFYPQILYPLLWVGPLLGWISLNRLWGHPIDLRGFTHGRGSYVFTWALAALICGFFWEMWNYFSLAKWVYATPYFQAFPIFEMPLAGYLGYLPFGLECAVIISYLNECHYQKSLFSV